MANEALSRFARWWLDLYSDEELVGFALALGVEVSCVENVAANRREAVRRTTKARRSGPSC